MKVKELKYLIEQVYVDLLKESDEPVPENPIGDLEAGPETVLEDNTETLLEKFPALKAILIKLMTKDYQQFVDQIDWISPRPTSFRVNVANGQNFTLKWMGTNFEAQILGKKYFLGAVSEFQQALDKLARLYQEAPIKGTEDADLEGGEGGEADFGGGAGGGDFPGGEGGEGGEESFDEPAGEEGGGEDLGGEEIDFESGEEPVNESLVKFLLGK